MHISLRMQTWKTLLQHSGSGIFFPSITWSFKCSKTRSFNFTYCCVAFPLTHVSKLFLWAAYKIYETELLTRAQHVLSPIFLVSILVVCPCYLGWGFRCFSFQTKTLNIRHHSRQLKVPKLCLCIPFQRGSYVRVYLFSRQSILGIKG